MLIRRKRLDVQIALGRMCCQEHADLMPAELPAILDTWGKLPTQMGFCVVPNAEFEVFRKAANEACFKATGHFIWQPVKQETWLRTWVEAALLACLIDFLRIILPKETARFFLPLLALSLIALCVSVLAVFCWKMVSTKKR